MPSTDAVETVLDKNKTENIREAKAEDIARSDSDTEVRAEFNH